MTSPEHHIPPRLRPPTEMRTDPHDGIQMEAGLPDRRYHTCERCDGTGNDPASSDPAEPAEPADCTGEWFE